MGSKKMDEDEFVEPVLKYFIVAFNLITFIISVLSICGGAWLLAEFDSVISSDKNFSSVYDLTFDLAVYLIIVGIVGVIITSLAIAATYQENLFVLKLYNIVLVFLTIMGLVTGVTFLIFSGKITSTITEKLQSKYITLYYEDQFYKNVFDSLQGKYSCCGITDYKDWNGNPYHNCTSSSQSSLKCFVPSSCCIGYTTTTNAFCSGNVLADAGKETNINPSGCSNVIIETAAYAISVTAGCSIGFTVFFIINLGLVQWLILLVQKEKALFNTGYKTLKEELH